ncbi:amidohydrolase family protein [Mycobacterium yunnanensis]|uniref:Amidohydrolase family protein n=1 Tax=Mycobacterium yunnanensis TaxID=368477 RepID=A0A9X2Z429_9MYCO|nr:amidohydrolase family protein [Mycobacterium yunnanensis]MCV7423220.1 amidohydrolase family protein [Mycobacterium yunnanensis]
MLIVNATLLDGTVTDLRVGHLIEAVGVGLDPQSGEVVLEAGLGTVIPGLHDHHVHLRSAAAALGSVAVGPPDIRSESEFRHALATASVGADGWIRAVGYHDSVAGPLDRTSLDVLAPPVPVRVQHRSGASWTFNSIGLAKAGLTNLSDGRLHRADTSAGPGPLGDAASLRALSNVLASRGVTGVTDATPEYGAADIESLSAASLSGDFLPRMHLMAPPGVEAVLGSSQGPAKRILDDVDLDLDGLCRWVGRCHEGGRPVAVHSVTAAQLVVTIAALREMGVHPRDRIEHAAVIPDDCIADLAELGATVVTQPNFVAERGDQYLVDVPPEEHHQLWRVASLRRAGVPVALSTDMPFGYGDPWASMRAAVTRRTRNGVVLGAEERVSPIEALTMFLGLCDDPASPRTVATGEAGDLCVLRVPPDEALARLDSTDVIATIVGGEQVWPDPARR